MAGKADFQAASRRVALLAPSAREIVEARRLLIEAVTGLGHKVLALTPPASLAETEALSSLGVDVQAFDVKPSRVPMLERWRLKSEIARHFGAWRPSVVLVSGADLALAGARAARQSGVQRIICLANDVSELEVGAGNDAGVRAYVAAAGHADAIVCHNLDDQRSLERDGAGGGKARLVRLPGCGSWLDTQCPALPDLGRGPVFVMIAGGGHPDDVAVFTAAARLLRSEGLAFRAVVAIEPLALTGAMPMIVDGAEVAGPKVSPAKAIEGAHVVVQLSAVDGMPPRLLEALGMGRAIIASDRPGCRETADDCVNGCLVAASSGAAALAAAMRAFVLRPELIAGQCRASREKAERLFDARKITSELMKLLEL